MRRLFGKLGLVCLMGVLLSCYVSAYAGAFDLFGLFVENVFGSLFLACIGTGFLLYLIGWYCRMSPLLVNYVVLLYVCGLILGVMGWAFFGVILFFICVSYFGYQVFAFLTGR